MFHRFHDIKNNQDSQMMQGNSRSGTPVAPQDIRPPMFPHVLRPDASLTPQQTLSSTYPSSSSPSPSPSSSFVSQGGQLMPLGANIMYPGMKALGFPAQEAHRFMTEAYKVASEDPQKLSFLNPSRISETAQPHVSEQTRNSEDLEQISSNAQRQTVGSDQTRISGDNVPRLPYESQGSSSLQQLALDPQRLEAETQRMLASMERLPTNDQQKIVGETQRIPQSRTSTEGSQYSKTPLAMEDLKPKVPHGPAASSSSLLYSGPFSSSYLHYQDEALYKRHPYNDLSHGKRSSETRDTSSGEGPSQERTTPGDIMSHHLDMIGYNRNAYEQGGSVNASDTQSDNTRSDDFASLDLVSRHAAVRGPKDVFKARVPRVRQSKTHKCDYCELEFKNSTQLKNHTWRHTGEKPYSCELCHATFTQQSNLKTHMRIHTGERPYACEECSATFTQLSNLRTHQKTHTGEKPHECDVCGTRFSQQSNLKSHKMIHSGERPFKCDECESTFVQSTHLRNHMRIHTDERPYACTRCGARFRQLSNLKTHEKTHTGEKPHICDECGAAFAQKSNLKSHKIKLHSGEVQPSKRGRKKLEGIKPCICEECGAKFTLMSNLKIHMKLHTGEKPFTCSMCNACFAQRSNLKTHEKVHSDERPYQCNECPAAFKQKTNLKTHKMKRHPVKSLKIKILQDSQFMRHEGEILDREGSASSFIGEPIVQIREGRDPHGEFAGNSADEEYSEGDLRYGEEGSMQPVGTCAPYPIAPNYMAPSGGNITRMEENPFDPKF